MRISDWSSDVCSSDLQENLMAGGFNTATVTAPPDSGSIAQWITNQTDAVLQSAVAQPIEQLTTALLPIINMGLTLQFLAYAFAIMLGQGGMTVTEFFKKAVMVAIIAMVANARGDRKRVV